MSYPDDEIQALHTDIEDLRLRLGIVEIERDEAYAAADAAEARVGVEVDRRLWLERRLDAIRNALGQ